MSRQSVLAFLLVLLTTVFGVGNAWGEEKEYTFTAVATPSAAETDGFTFTFDKGSGSTAPAWNSGSSEARLYAKGSLTIDGGDNTITSIVFDYAVNKNKSGKAPTISSVSGATNFGSWNEETKTWSDATGDSKIVFATGGDAGNLGFKSVTITYTGSSNPVVLESIAVSGDLTNKDYETTDALDLTGLTVTGFYEDETNTEITSGLTWQVRTNNTSEAVNLDAYTLTAGQTSVQVQATVGNVNSEWYSINGLTVTEHIVTPGEYTINLNNTLYGVSTGNNAAEQSASQKDITVVSGCTSNASSKTYYDTGHIRYYADSYLRISVPSGYVIKFIVFTASGTWNGNITANTGTYTNETKTWSGSAQEVDFSFVAQNRASSIKVTYAATAKSAVTIDDAIENGIVDVTGAADLSTVAEGTELTLSNTPANGYKFGSYTVYKTGDTETTITVTNNKFIMPAFDVTVSATFEETKTLTGIALTGEYPTVFLTGDAFSHEGMTVTANYDDETSANVTDDATFIGYDMSAAGAQTVTVSYTEGTTQTQTYEITVKDAYTVAEILPLVPAQNAGSLATKVKGYISQIDQYNSSYNSITYWISDDGKTTSDKLEVYSGKNVGNTNFSSIDDLEVGDFVTITGNVKTHTNGVKEFDKNNYIITGGRIQKGSVTSVAVSGTATKTTYSANETFETAGLVVTATYENGFKEVVTEGITWGDDLTDHKVAATGTVHVTATVGGVISAAYGVAIEVSTKTLSSIAVETASYTVYKGQALPEPVITATYTEGEPADVSAEAVYDTESEFDNTTVDTYTITVSYTFGGETKTATYEVTVKEYANADNAPYSVTEALNIIVNAIGNTESASEIVVTGTVSEAKINNYNNRYKISDGENELLVYNGKGFDNESFTNANYPQVGDVVIVKGKVINYNGNTPEFASGKSYLLSQVRPTTLAIEDIASFEVGATDLTESDLDITTPSDGDITFVSGDDAVATIEANAIHAVAPGTVTITANLAATANENALNYAAASTTFNVTVIAAQEKYAITFDGNGADGGSAPEAIADKAAGAEVTLPANSYTKTGGYTFNGWKVFYVDGESVEHEVTISENAFTMPAFAVTIQAQWAEVSEWAVKYTSNVTLTAGTGAQAAKVRFTADGEQYDAVKAGTSKAGGSITVTVPAQATKLHLHVAGWTGENPTISITAPEGVTVTPASISATADAGMKSNSPFTLENNPVEQYLVLSLEGNTEEIQLTFSTDDGNKRFALYGVNQEGGVLPELQSLAISGDLENKTYEAGAALNMAGLTVMGTYNIGDPVDVTDQVEQWLYNALQVGDESVTIAAKIGDVTSPDVEITGLTVTDPTPTIYVNKQNVNFASVEVGAAVPAPQTITVTLTNVAAVTATLGGDNADAFSISTESLTESGDITISVLANTAAAASYSATLTISDGAEGADDKTVNLSFAVTAPVVDDDVTGTWTLVTDATTLAAGKKVIIAQYVEADGAINTMAGQATNNRSVIASTVAGATLTPTVGTKVMTLADAGEGHFYLQTSDGEYLYNASTSSKSYLRTKAEEENVSWTIAVDAEGVATITSVENTNRTKMRYNPNTSGSPLFNCYASGQEDIALYMLEEDTPEPAADYTRDVKNGNYGTICLPQAGTITGATLFEIASFENGMIYMDEVGSTMEAGKPYIFQATADQLNVTYTSGAQVAAGKANGLYGFYNLSNMATDDADKLDLEEDKGNYILYQNAYWLVSGREAYINNFRAYIKLGEISTTATEPVPGAAPRRRVAMAVHGEQVATGVDQVPSDQVTSTKVLINGQLFILRGEKMYDVTGKLVK